MREFDTPKVIWMLIGPVIPVGDSRIDPVRLDNLKELVEATDLMLDGIIQVAAGKDSHMDSVKKAGVCASEYLEGLTGTMLDWTGA